jgi:hypothetical protein
MAAGRNELNEQLFAALFTKPVDTQLVDGLLSQGADVAESNHKALRQALDKNDIGLFQVLMKYLDFAQQEDMLGGPGLTVLEIIFKPRKKARYEGEGVSAATLSKIFDLLQATPEKFDNVPVDVLGKLFVPLLAAASNAEQRIALIKKLLSRGVTPNAKSSNLDSYTGDMYESSPLLYLACLEDGADAIRLLLEAGADPTLRTSKTSTPIEAAASWARTSSMGNSRPGCWNNVLAILQHSQLPLPPELLSRALGFACDVQDEQQRSDIFTVLFAAKADLVSPYAKSEKYFPTTGNPQDVRNFAATYYLKKLAQSGYWSSLQLFMPFIDKSGLDLKITEFNKKPKTAKEEWGEIFTLALSDATPESLQVAKQLLDLGVSVNEQAHLNRDAGYSERSYDNAVYSFPILLVARRKDFDLLRSLLQAGADPNNAEFGKRKTKDIFIILMENGATDFIPELLSLTQVKLKPEILNETIRAIIRAGNHEARFVIEPLLKAGALSSEQGGNNSLLDLAVFKQDKEFVALLLKFGAKPSRLQSDVKLLELGGDELVAVYATLENEIKEREAEGARRHAEYEATQRQEMLRREQAAHEKSLREQAAKAALKEKSAPTSFASQKIQRIEGVTLQRIVEDSATGMQRIEDVTLQQMVEDIATLTSMQQFFADFKCVNEDLGDNFLANQKGTPTEQWEAIKKQKTAHPNGPVAIATKLAQKYPGKCDAANSDFLVDLRLEKFKHERLWVWMKFWNWGKNTVVHKEEESQLTFYRASSFEKYVQALPVTGKQKLATEMRKAAADEKNTSRSANVIRQLKK